jgi:hypothetical protein
MEGKGRLFFTAVDFVFFVNGRFSASFAVFLQLKLISCVLNILFGRIVKIITLGAL